MPITTGNFAKALWPGVNKWYGKAYDEHKPEWPELFDKFTSRRAWEEDVGVSSFGGDGGFEGGFGRRRSDGGERKVCEG